MKRVVVTSSCAAVIDFDAPAVKVPRRVYTEEDWNPRTWEEALSGTPNAAYQASKKFAEKSGMYFPPCSRLWDEKIDADGYQLGTFSKPKSRVSIS